MFTHIVVFEGGPPARYNAYISRVLQCRALVVIADGFRREVAASDPVREVETVLDLHHGYVVVHPADVVVLMAVEYIICGVLSSSS